ncbi:hypothetical protein Mapa_012154 [Marchantia paleacea]|nr:hypothetical protein Mapa_012154 [Marchantia paleacea]
MAPHCHRLSSPPSDGFSALGVTLGTSGSPRAREKALLARPGSAWKALPGGNKCFFNQIIVLLVVFAILTSVLVILNSFGTLLAWQQCISTRLTDTLSRDEIQSFPDILDLHKLELDDSYAGDSAAPVPPAALPTVSRSAKHKLRKETPAIDFSALKESWFLKQLNATKRCQYKPTTDVYVFGLEKPSVEGVVRLPVDEDHEIFFVSYDQNAVRRCSGGDYFEIDLDAGAEWKSRPPVKDMGDGGYAVKLRVDRRFAGTYSFKVVLLFGGFSGLYRKPQKFAVFKLILNVTMEFFVPEERFELVESTADDALPLCSTEDLETYPWQGRWTRNKVNESCTADSQGRWRCLDANEPCELPYCEGPVGSLESNGWAYSAHCHFRIFTQEEAWQCMNGKHVLFWGDSNHPDTSRNVVNFLLGGNSNNLPRIYDRNFSNPRDPDQQVRFSVVFNGHVVMKFNNMGLSVLRNQSYRSSIQTMLSPESGNHIPHAMILNSGIHDGIWWKDLREYARAAKDASEFWASVWRNTSEDETKRPKVVYRTTIAPAGLSRNMPANPQKMEVLNAIIVENMVSAFGRENLRIVDAFDMTFPFHYDNFYSDGGHYGRIPNPNSWWPGGHMYFVDVMLAHILLNAICPL